MHYRSEGESTHDRTTQDPVDASAGRPVKMKCSYCGAVYDGSTARFRPFCSHRCQQIDLGHWLNESYGLPYEGEHDQPFEGVDEDDSDA